MPIQLDDPIRRAEVASHSAAPPNPRRAARPWGAADAGRLRVAAVCRQAALGARPHEPRRGAVTHFYRLSPKATR